MTVGSFDARAFRACCTTLWMACADSGAGSELIAHELEHVLEQVRGIDLKSEARRKRGVWKAFGGFESQRAIDVGRLVAAEVKGP